MIARVSSIALVGLDARPIEVEVDLQGGLPEFHIVGLPSAAVREARQRVRSAIHSSEEVWPDRKITVNLAPSDLRKEGALLDLALAIGILVASGRGDRAKVGRYLFLGELALDGRLRPVRGALAAAMAARRDDGIVGVVVPRHNAAEASLVGGVEVIGASHLVEALAFASGEMAPEVTPPPTEYLLRCEDVRGPDLAEVRGQALARRALEIAAAGGHNVLMVGPPGSGKTMLARRLPGILPPMTIEEALEVTHIWSVAGLLRPGRPLVATRPFRSPHHHASPASIIGGGSPYARPGEISLAHNGVLFLDEIPLFSRATLDGLRQPLEDGEVIVARQGSTAHFPSRFCLVAAANPCPCGRLGDRASPCICPPGRFEAYRSRLSGPLLDRFDLFADVPRLDTSEMLEAQTGEASGEVRQRVLAAREFAANRPPHDEADPVSELTVPARQFIRAALTREPESARGAGRILKVARTIADLGGSELVEEEHVAEAVQFRRIVWS